ncbi:hypothetical protein KR018_010888 [Drosophila ironensis]|nr:hypothetical protein KR018_010888 [Drosophila ironensis]
MSKGTGPFSKLYNATISAIDKFVPEVAQPLWQSPAGPKTVFFWAPLFKWGLVLAGLGDALNRPAHVISVNQCAILAATGVIWSRWCVVIIPKNYTLLAANMAMATLQSYLIYKHLKWRSESGQAAYSFSDSYYPEPSWDDW